MSELTGQQLPAWDTASGRRIGGGVITTQAFQSALATGQVRRRFPLLPLVTAAEFTADGRFLLTASAAGTALVRDTQAFAARVTRRTWEDLAGRDAPAAFVAVNSLVAAPKQAIRLLAEHLRPGRVDAARVADWIADLDAESFARREQAERQLAGLEEHGEESLRQALKKEPSTEARARLRRLIQRSEEGGAGRLLKKLAGGYPGSALMQEAKEVLARLEQTGRPGEWPACRISSLPRSGQQGQSSGPGR